MKMEKSGLTLYTTLKKIIKKETATSWYREALNKLVTFKTPKSSNPQALRYDIYVMTPIQWCLYGCQGLALSGVFAYVFYRSIVVFLILIPFGILYPILKRKELKEKRLEQLNVEFKEGISLLSSFLSAGYSVENAFSSSVRELKLLFGEDGLITIEFKHIENQIKINRSVEQALMEFATRSGLDDVKNFAEVFVAAKRSGGELVSIISHSANIIRDKISVRQEILTMSASKQFEQKVMNMIPFFIVIYIDLTSPGFFQVMYTTAIGKAVMTVCMVLYILAFFISRKIMSIEI